MKNVNGSHLIYGKQLKAKYQIKSFFLSIIFLWFDGGKNIRNSSRNCSICLDPLYPGSLTIIPSPMVGEPKKK